MGWMLPGGHVTCDETAEAAVVREVEEETGLRCSVVGLVGHRSRVDPEENLSTVAFLLREEEGSLRGGSQVPEARRFTLEEIESLELRPLYRTMGTAALEGKLSVLAPLRPPEFQEPIPSTLFMGSKG